MSILRKRIDALEHTQAQREQELAGRLHAFLSSHTQEQIEHIRQYTPTAQEIAAFDAGALEGVSDDAILWHVLAILDRAVERKQGVNE